MQFIPDSMKKKKKSHNYFIIIQNKDIVFINDTEYLSDFKV